MKKQVFIALLSAIFLLPPLYAQNRVDSLEARLSVVTGPQRVAVLAQLVQAAYSDDAEKAVTYGREAVSLLAQYPEADLLRQVWYWKGRAHEHLGQYDSVLVQGEQLRAWARATGDAGGEAEGAFLEGNGHLLLGSYAAGLASLHEAVAAYEALGDEEGVAMSFNAIGDIHEIQGAYDEALAYYRRALVLREALGDQRGLADSFHSIGNIHEIQGIYGEALIHYSRALAIDEALGDQRGLAASFNNIGNIHEIQGAYGEALTYYTRALAIDEALGDQQGMAASFNSIGNIHEIQGAYGEALTYYSRALAIDEALGDQQGIANSFNNIGSLNRQQGRLDDALTYTARALAIADSVRALPLVRDIYQERVLIFEQQGRFDEALRAHRAFKATHDSLFTTESQAVIAELQQQYRTQEQQQRIQLLERDQQIQELWFFGLIGGLVLLALIAFLVYNRYRLKNHAHAALTDAHDTLQQTHERLQATQQQLIHAEKMASLGQLTAGIAHEIKNPLNFVNNFSELSVEIAEDLEAEIAAHTDKPVAEIEEELKAMLADLKFNAQKINHHGRRADGIVHAMMQHASGGIKQRESTDINTLVSKHIKLAYHGKRTRVPDLKVEIKRELGQDAGVVEMVPQEIGRVLLNLLSNAFDAVHEHALTVDGDYVPTVTVSTRLVDSQVAIRVSDNGSGIPPAIRDRIFEPFFTTKPTGSGTGLGLSLSYDIVRQGHGGTLSVESEEGQGTTFIVMLPVTHHEPASST